VRATVAPLAEKVKGVLNGDTQFLDQLASSVKRVVFTGAVTATVGWDFFEQSPATFDQCRFVMRAATAYSRMHLP